MDKGGIMQLSEKSQQMEKELEKIPIYMDETLLTILINMELERQGHWHACDAVREEWNEEWDKQQELKSQLENPKSNLVLSI